MPGIDRPSWARGDGCPESSSELVTQAHADSMGANCLCRGAGRGLQPVRIFRAERIFKSQVIAPNGPGRKSSSLLRNNAAR